MNVSRIRRLLKLLGLLQGGRGYNAHALAQACEVSRRTIFRDLDALRSAGVPLVYDRDSGHFHIPGTYFLPPTNFTAEEALAVLVLCHELGDDAHLPFYSAARTAAVKLDNNLPRRLRELLRSVSGSVRIKMRATNRMQGQETVYQQLLGAVSERKAVRIGYDSFAERKLISTKLNPYRLLFSGHSWYAIGRSSLHRSCRTFNVRRIASLERLSDSFLVPANFTVERYLRNAWHLIPERGPDHEVAVQFKPMVARNVAEVAWHHTQSTELLDDGSLLFRATVSGIGEISWWILGYGDQAEVLAPPELRELVASRARNMARQYDS